MGHFIPGQLQDLLPDDFCRHDPFRLVRIHVLRIKAGAHRQAGFDFLQKRCKVLIGQGGQGQDAAEGVFFLEMGDDGQQALLVGDLVDFVQHQDHWSFTFFLQPLQDDLFSLAPFFRGIHHEQYHIHFLDGIYR